MSPTPHLLLAALPLHAPVAMPGTVGGVPGVVGRGVAGWVVGRAIPVPTQDHPRTRYLDISSLKALPTAK